MSDLVIDTQQPTTVDLPANVSGEGKAAEPSPDVSADTGKVFTQDELNSFVAKAKRDERNKFTDYETVKAKADQFDALAEANKSEAQRMADALAAVQRENEALRESQLRSDVARAKGLPDRLVSRLTGKTRDELEADADSLLEILKPSTSEPQQQRANVQRRPVEQLAGGGRPAPTDPSEGLSVADILAKIPHRR